VVPSPVLLLELEPELELSPLELELSPLELELSPLELPVKLTAPLLAVSPLLVGAPVSLSLADPPVLVGTVPELVPELLVAVVLAPELVDPLEPAVSVVATGSPQPTARTHPIAPHTVVRRMPTSITGPASTRRVGLSTREVGRRAPIRACPRCVTPRPCA
jgi:hypothetical protein